MCLSSVSKICSSKGAKAFTDILYLIQVKAVLFAVTQSSWDDGAHQED